MQYCAKRLCNYHNLKWKLELKMKTAKHAKSKCFGKWHHMHTKHFQKFHIIAFILYPLTHDTAWWSSGLYGNCFFPQNSRDVCVCMGVSENNPLSLLVYSSWLNTASDGCYFYSNLPRTIYCFPVGAIGSLCGLNTHINKIKIY